MNGLTIKGSQELQEGWAWRTRHGDLVQPSAMETRHLFYTLRMIWHNRMPREAWIVESPRLYSFGPAYSNDYLLEAIRHLSVELATRTDMTKDWADQLRLMVTYFNSRVYSPTLVAA